MFALLMLGGILAYVFIAGLTYVFMVTYINETDTSDVTVSILWPITGGIVLSIIVFFTPYRIIKGRWPNLEGK